LNVFIFLGPTLARDVASRELDATYLSPAAQGDIFRAAKERPFAIGIIDGYFDRVPAVWHKEVLWAISHGIRVFGASSMGALRAAELRVFGMEGVGAVYEAFRSGVLEDDDEVAVAHGEASDGYRATSEAMVNIRATLRRAEQECVVSGPLREHLEALAKSIFYPDRSYPRLLQCASDAGLDAAACGELRSFVKSNRVDQKCEDAIALLRRIRQCRADGEPFRPPAFPFSHTAAWSEVVEWAEAQPPISRSSDAVSVDLVAAEVRARGLQGAEFANALNRVVAGVLARRDDAISSRSPFEEADRVRRATGARMGMAPMEDAAFRQWLSDHALTNDSYRALVEQQAQLNWLRGRFREDIDRHVVDELRCTGEYAALARRASDKQRVLGERGLDEPTLEDGGLTERGLLSWYFEQRLGCPVPEDLEAFLLEFGLKDVPALRREALRELLYARLTATEQRG
jgi:hypothetical protein